MSATRLRWPRLTFGRCMVDCDALASGGHGMCYSHLFRWRDAGKPRGAALGRWISKVSRGLPAARFLDLNGLSERLRLEMLVALTVSIERSRRTRINELRQGASLLRACQADSILAIDVSQVKERPRLFIRFAQDGFCWRALPRGGVSRGCLGSAGVRECPSKPA